MSAQGERCPWCDQPIPPDKMAQLQRELEEGREVGRIGRPSKPPVAGERMSLGLKVTADIKSRIDQAARESGRTQSQEAEARIERSFDREDLLPEVLTLAYGSEMAGILMMLGIGMTKTGFRYHHRTSQADDDNWVADARAFDQAVRAGVALLSAVRPRRPSGRPYTMDSVSDLPPLYARQMIDILRGRARASTNPTMNAIRALLGPLAARLAKTPASARKEPKS